MGIAIDGPRCTKSMCGWMKGLQLQVASEMAPGLHSQHFEMHKLSLSILLVILALCCYEANAVVCTSILSDFKFPTPPEAYEAKLEVKRFTDEISFGSRLQISKAQVISFFFVHRGL
ncbi:PREDICTED: secretoglobin family 1D member 4-like [Ceratotherium simum simum]|uniref:Secretoglobin family 1D member 4-like n=1 Tax=Ceratotherium simum simum TaxID=73337 RepID=A0ABM1D9Z6_CERSS|nr:PREDICTED: secretoglobin family 1D member 4-like [Ceratotherium simum simum]